MSTPDPDRAAALDPSVPVMARLLTDLRRELTALTGPDGTPLFTADEIADLLALAAQGKL